METTIRIAGILLLAATLLIGCSDSQNPVVNPSTSENLLKVGLGTTTTGDSSSITIVHGIPGVTVDVYVNGILALDNFTFGTFTKPISFAAGKYWIVILADASQDTVYKDSVSVAAGLMASLVAHLTEAGKATLTAFLDDFSNIAPGNGRLVVRHVAAAPAVDVNLYKSAVTKKLFGKFAGLTNGKEARLDLRPGRYTATISAAGSSSTLLGPVAVQKRPKELFTVYAVGSLEGGTFTLLVQKQSLNFGKPLSER
jgi:hypothetical protein